MTQSAPAISADGVDLTWAEVAGTRGIDEEESERGVLGGEGISSIS
jgi:hypothetical protein